MANDSAIEIIQRIQASLPPCKNAGDYYDNKRREAELLREAIASCSNPAVERVLVRQLELVEQVGD